MVPQSTPARQTSPPYYSDEAVTLYCGDALDVVSSIPDQSVDCCVTSPPYYGLRDYGQPGQYGLETSPAEYVERMRGLFAEVRRVLTDDGTLWLNLGDSYSASAGQGNKGPAVRLQGGGRPSGRRDRMFMPAPSPSRFDRPAKSLLGIPWRTAFALQDDGWILRNDIIWSKPNAMPESVTDRLANRYEHLFMFSRSRRYWFDLDPIREAQVYATDSVKVSWGRGDGNAEVPGQKLQKRNGREHGRAVSNLAPTGQQHLSGHAEGRNPGDVWTIPTSPFPGAHFAVFPVEIPRRAIAAGCKPQGTVLDPFSGSGTTGMAAAQLGRRYIGIDLSAEYLDLSLRTRLAQTALLDGGAA